VAGILRQAGIDKYKMKVIDTATNADRPEEHNNGEFSIEVIIRKQKS
jgi:hypothetical protein